MSFNDSAFYITLLCIVRGFYRQKSTITNLFLFIFELRISPSISCPRHPFEYNTTVSWYGISYLSLLLLLLLLLLDGKSATVGGLRRSARQGPGRRRARGLAPPDLAAAAGGSDCRRPGGRRLCARGCASGRAAQGRYRIRDRYGDHVFRAEDADAPGRAGPTRAIYRPVVRVRVLLRGGRGRPSSRRLALRRPDNRVSRSAGRRHRVGRGRIQYCGVRLTSRRDGGAKP